MYLEFASGRSFYAVNEWEGIPPLIAEDSHIVASHLTWGSVITVARGHTNGGLGDCGLPTMQGAFTVKYT